MRKSIPMSDFKKHLAAKPALRKLAIRKDREGPKGNETLRFLSPLESLFFPCQNAERLALDSQLPSLRRNDTTPARRPVASSQTHRNEFPAGYSLASCSPAVPASAFPASTILQEWSFVRRADFSERYVSNVAAVSKKTAVH